MNIQTTDAQGLFTKKLIAVYKEKTTPTKFLNSFFTEDISDGLEVSIGVQRGSEKIAVDVERGSDGNRNTFSKSTEKIFTPPYFNEYWDITSLDFYDRLWRASEISDMALAQLVNSAVEKTQALEDKIDRAYELQRAQAFLTGIVTLSQGVGKIDFGRKAGSMVDLAGTTGYFATGGVIPFLAYEAGALFLQTVGKTGATTFNAIHGSQAIADLYANAKFLERQNLMNLSLDLIQVPQKNSEGGVYHGQITAGVYKVNIWSYPQFYDNAINVQTPYIDPKKVVMLPESPKMVMAYAAVPQLLDPGQAPLTGKFIVSQFTDEKRKTREYHVESAGVPVPVAIDQIYTFKAVA
jgi:hypothetical protein